MSGYNSPQVSKSSPSREVSSLSTKLVEGDTGLMGPKHNSGLPDRLLLNSTSNCNTSLSTILCRADSPDFRGGNRVTTEGSNRGSSTCRADRFLFKPLSGPKEGWRTTPSNKSQSPKQLCEQGTFQNRGHSYSERSPEKGRLDGQNRFERCLLFNTHSPQPQKIPQLHVPREDLPIQLPTLRPILSPMGVHKNSKTSTSNPPREGSTANSLYRRSVTFGGVKRLDSRPSDWNELSPRMSRIHCEYQEINTEPSTGNGILGSVCGLTSNGNQASPSQNQTNSSRSSQAGKTGNDSSSNVSTTTRQYECYELCPSTQTPVLSPYADGTDQHIGAELPML